MVVVVAVLDGPLTLLQFLKVFEIFEVVFIFVVCNKGVSVLSGPLTLLKF
jgi:hypothetical protein